MYRTLHVIFMGSCLCFAVVLLFGALPGCNQGKPAAKDKTDKTAAEHLDIGPHGGPCAEWGKEDYHAEFIVDAEKKEVTIYILSGDPKKPPKEGTKVTDVKLAIVGSNPLVQLDLKHDPKESGDKGIAFKGTHDSFAKPEGMEVNISGKVGDTPYTGDVRYKAPTKSAAELYLTPGGIYTEADIKANGNTTPDEKFTGRKFAHLIDLKPGDKICPITDKKANTECAWIVQGQRYEFCCRPCVDDFMEMAHSKEDSKKIKDAKEYVHKGS